MFMPLKDEKGLTSNLGSSNGLIIFSHRCHLLHYDIDVKLHADLLIIVPDERYFHSVKSICTRLRFECYIFEKVYLKET